MEAKIRKIQELKKEKNKGMIRVKKQKYCIQVKGMLRKCLTKI